MPTIVVVPQPGATVVPVSQRNVVLVGSGPGVAYFLRSVPVAAGVPTAGQALVYNGTAAAWADIATQVEFDALEDALADHVANQSNPHVVTAAQVGAYTIAAVNAIASELSADTATVAGALSAHAALQNNPHVVTKTQVGLGNVEDVALSTWAGSGNITTVGTIASGTWNATAITWAKVDKTGSSLADLATRSAADLSSGTLAYARLPTGGGVWDQGGGLTLTTAAGTGFLFEGGALRVSRVGAAANASIFFDSDAGRFRNFIFQTGGVDRWRIVVTNTAEGGSNAGSDFEVRSFTDAGAAIDTPLTIVRAAGGAITLARMLCINDTSNANMTVGLTVNQGSADNQILALKSSDVATGLTSVTTMAVESDDFLTVSKFSATLGGVLLQALGEDAAVTQVFTVRAYGGTASTTKTSAGVGLITFYASEHDGANALANITADGNIFAVRGRIGAADVTCAMVDANATAGNTRLLIYDVDNAALERVSVGVADSGGLGFKLLRIPN